MSKIWSITLAVGFSLNLLMYVYIFYLGGDFTLGNLITFLVFIILQVGFIIKKVIFDGEPD